MILSQKTCQAELAKYNLLPRKYYGQVFTTDPEVIGTLIETIRTIYRPGTKIIEIGGGLGYITQALTEAFEDVDSIEYDKDLFEVLANKFINMRHAERTNVSRRMYKKFVHNKKMLYLKEKSDNLNKFFEHNFISKNKISNLKLIHGDVLEYSPPKKDYLLVGNIPFHISGRLYRRFMSDLKHKPYGMVFITDKQYASTLMGQPPRCYRVSLQAQAYGKIEIIKDVSPASVYPEPKVMSCIMKITHQPVKLPKNFWEVVNYHFEHFPTEEVESPKTLNLQDWIDLSVRRANPPA